MKIQSLSVRNFRGIQGLEIENLTDTIVIAGQNGSGKSCIFDAIRLLKSLYGGYQQNEYQHFFNEFQIQLHGGAINLRRLFNNSAHPISIKCSFQLRDREKEYINRHAAELLEEQIWQALLPEAFQFGGYRKAMFAAQFRERQPEVKARVADSLPHVYADLAKPLHLGSATISPTGEINLESSTVLPLVFVNYRPRNIGVIDYHGAQRHYGRELVQGINLDLEQANQARSQSTLYNYNAKYNNVKSEMAGNYIKAMLAEKADKIPESGEESLASAMQELFSTFFPEKTFLGPQPTKDGSLSFPVRTQNGTVHDLDELSSGEKEILYGYLRIRSSAPRDSIILLDEPELHLNPRLIRGLPDFYKNHLSDKLQNQLWLVTHSDSLIREAIGKSGMNVYHMLPCSADVSVASQLRPLVATKDLDVVMTDLVGDLASFKPGAKGVLLEGGGDSDFDKNLITTLFDEEVKGLNIISGSNKARVKALHEVLAKAHEKGDLPIKFYSIVDLDSDSNVAPDVLMQFQWDVYHIENYLLNSEFIAQTVNMSRLKDKISVSDVETHLQNAARQIVPELIQHKLKEYVNSKIVSAINLNFDPSAKSVSGDLRQAVDRSLSRISAAESELSQTVIEEKYQQFQKEAEISFGNGTWKRNLPGREILKRFVSISALPTNYEAFRNQIVATMKAASHKPKGMRAIIQKIVLD